MFSRAFFHSIRLEARRRPLGIFPVIGELAAGWAALAFSAEENAALAKRRALVRALVLLEGKKAAVRVYCIRDEAKRSASLAGV